MTSGGPVAARLPDGRRLHLQHGPIDLIIEAETVDRGDGRGRDVAFAAAWTRFRSILTELVAELPRLRRPTGSLDGRFRSPVARRMFLATRPHANTAFITPMAAVAGSVADEILEVMTGSGPLRRAYVNNGGDIALHFGTPEANYRARIAGLGGECHGDVRIDRASGIGGLATSGTGGRSLSLGIADSVTVLGPSAAAADAAATLIANAVDLSGDHPAIDRCPATDLDPDSDLGRQRVVTACRRLEPADVDRALTGGETAARHMVTTGLVRGAALFLQGRSRIVDSGAVLARPEPGRAPGFAAVKGGA
ncbi:MAG: UPF0280 family protein [Paracoccaceae bacterium]|nr:UPF0280 family protein [Paracoccaceae bacterium]